MSELSIRFMEFSKAVLACCRSTRTTPVSRPLINQLVRSAASIGANYQEAQSGISRKDFRAKIFICKKEAEETKYWLELLQTCHPEKETELAQLWQEAHAIVKILQTITTKLNQPS